MNELEAAMANTTVEDFAIEARRLTTRTLRAKLRKARHGAEHHHGKNTWLGRQRLNEVAAIEQELKDRGVEVPAS